MGWLSPRFLPGANSCLSFLWLPRAVTLLAAMNGTGTTVQAVTLSSSTTLNYCGNIEVEVLSTGIVGSATARWRLNGGAWTNFTIQSSVDLDGTPFTLGFPAGTYTIGDAYRSVINTMLDDRANAWEGTSSSAAVLPFVGSINSKPTIRTNGVDRFIRTNASALSTALVGGIRTPLTICGAFRYNGPLAPGVNQAVMSLCNGASGQGVLQWSVSATTGLWRVSKRGDSGGTTAVDGGAADNNAHTFALVQTGTNVTLEIDNVATINNVAQNVAATVTAQFFEIGASHTTGAPSEFFGDIDWFGHAAYSGVLSANSRAREHQFWKNMCGL